VQGLEFKLQYTKDKNKNKTKNKTGVAEASPLSVCGTVLHMSHLRGITLQT
jgi:hypothetical protein